MKPVEMRKLTRMEALTLLALARQIRATVDGEVAGLLERVAAGDDSALVPMVDRFVEIGRPADGERLRKLLTD